MYPQENSARMLMSLDGLWKFELPEKRKNDENPTSASVGENSADVKTELTSGMEDSICENGLPKNAELIYVPAAYNDQREEERYRTHRGLAYYERSFTIPKLWQEQRVFLRFGSVTHNARVWIDGKLLCEHRGGFLPFEAEVTDHIVVGKKHRINVEVDNKIGSFSLPVGNDNGMAFFGSDNAQVPAVQETKRWRGDINLPNFDFFNYAGIQRHVFLYTVPRDYIKDITIVPRVKDGSGTVDFELKLCGVDEALKNLKVELLDSEENVVAVCDLDSVTCKNDMTGYESDQATCIADKVVENEIKASGYATVCGTIKAPEVMLWEPYPGTPYLYKLKVTFGDDEYTEEFGFRTIEVVGRKFLLNGKPFYFKGFGKHEDFYIRGKGTDELLNVKDASLLHWIGANSFRTSHYPYAEEMYRLCDREGIVIIDETPAVGITAGGAFDPYKKYPLRDYHKQVIKDMIDRDKNHPCVVMWSVGNEPDTECFPDSAYDYWRDMYDIAHAADLQGRPVTFACVQNDYTKDKVTKTMDVVCINRYYGWYNLSGDLDSACHAWDVELEFWEKIGKPVIITEYGADCIQGLHGTVAEMFTEEFQKEYYRRIDSVFDKRDFIIGEHPWCFADFGTLQGIVRPDGNRKGVFTRERRPKLAAHFLRERWNEIPNFDYKC